MGVQVYRPLTQNPYHVIFISMHKVANIANNYLSAHPTAELKPKDGPYKNSSTETKDARFKKTLSTKPRNIKWKDPATRTCCPIKVLPSESGYLNAATALQADSTASSQVEATFSMKGN